MTRSRPPDEIDREIRDEFESHLSERVADNLRRGLSEPDARREAIARFGALPTLLRKSTRVRRLGRSIRRTLMNDGRQAWLALVRSPGAPMLAALVAAIGIATALSAARLGDALLVRSPAGVVRPWELHSLLASVGRDDGNVPVLMSYVAFQAVAQAAPDTAPIAWSQRDFHVTTPGHGRVWPGAFVTGRYFQTIGVRAAAGRLLDDGDVAARRPVVVVSARMSRALGGHAQNIRVNGRPFDVVGIAQPGFYGMEGGHSVDLWIPITSEPEISRPRVFPDGRRVQGYLNVPSIGWLRAAVRIPSDRPIEEIRARLTSGLATVPRAPGSRPSPALLVDRPWLSPFSGERDQLLAVVAPISWAVGLTLLLTSACLGSLFVGRLADRQRDIAVRLALGAGRTRVIRLAVIDVTVATTAGAALALPLSELVLGIAGRLQIVSGITVDNAVTSGIDLRVIGLVAGCAAVVAGIGAFAPALAALQLTRTTVVHSSRVTWSGNRFRRVLMTAQAAAGVALLGAALLLAKSISGLRAQPLGYDATSVGFIELSPAAGGLDAAERKTLAARLEELPLPDGASIALTSAVPYGTETSLFIAAENAAPETRVFPINVAYIAGPYFEMLGIRPLAGRSFTAADRDRNVAIVSAPFASYYWPGRSAVGQVLRKGGVNGTPVDIIGVVPGLRDGGLRGQPTSRVYLPLSEDADALAVVMRHPSLSPAELVHAAAPTVRALDDRLVVVRSGTLADLARRTLEQRELFRSLTLAVAIGSLVMVAAGVWGLAHGSLRRRWREFGIRQALGGGRAHIVRLAIGDAIVVAVVGAAIGIVGGWQLGRVFRSWLFGVAPHDPWLLALAAAVVAVAAFAGAAAPAGRATHVDTASLLREDA